MGAKGGLGSIGRLRLLAGLLLVAALLLRLAPTVVSPSLNWGDEVFQVMEPAHRLVFGTGLLTWEFAAHIRSWLLPGAVAGIMELAHLLGGGPRLYLPATALCFAALSMVPVICTFAWCRPVFGIWAAFAAAAVCALAPELIYFGARSSAETAAAHILVGAIYLCIPYLPRNDRRGGARPSRSDAISPEPRAPGARPRPLLGGLALGLALALRPQIAPAALVLAIWPGWSGRARMATGAALAIGAASLLDWITLGAPGASIWRYAAINVHGGASASFGVQPWYYFLLAEAAIWGIALPVPVALCLVGAASWLLPLAAGVSITAAHMLIAHKEHRFIYPALVQFAVSGGIGLADLSSRFGAPRRRAAIGCIALWALVCVDVWQGPSMAALRARVHDNLVVADRAARLPGICGIGMGPGPDAWVAYGGYTHLHQDVPLFWPANQTAFATEQPGFNLLLSETPQPGYKILFCSGQICAAERQGACTPRPPDPLPAMPGQRVKMSAGKP